MQTCNEHPPKVLMTTEIIKRLLAWTTNIGHVVISISLIVAVLVISAHFFLDVYNAIHSRSLFSGFISSLAIMLLLWTMLELIQTERGYLRGEPIQVAVFVEVAIVVIVREIILLPIEDTAPTFEAVEKWAIAALLLGLTYLLLRVGGSRFSRHTEINNK